MKNSSILWRNMEQNMLKLLVVLLSFCMGSNKNSTLVIVYDSDNYVGNISKTYYSNDDFLLLVEENMHYVTKSIYSHTNDETYRFLESKLANTKEHFEGDFSALFRSLSHEVIPLEDKMEILGYSCSGYKVKDLEFNKEYTFFTTEELKVNFKHEFNHYFDKLPGFPMLIESSNGLYYKTSSIKKIPYDERRFDINRELSFEELDLKKIDQLLMQKTGISIKSFK